MAQEVDYKKEPFDAPPDVKERDLVAEAEAEKVPLNPYTKSYKTKHPATGGSANPDGKPAPDAKVEFNPEGPRPAAPAKKDTK